MTDLGAQTNDSSDYPDFGFRVAETVAQSKADRGLLICGTGIGMSIAANKVRGIRAAVVHDEETAKASRTHNDSNVLCLGERVARDETLLANLLEIWLTTPFDTGGRHTRRVAKIGQYEEQHAGR